MEDRHRQLPRDYQRAFEQGERTGDLVLLTLFSCPWPVVLTKGECIRYGTGATAEWFGLARDMPIVRMDANEPVSFDRISVCVAVPPAATLPFQSYRQYHELHGILRPKSWGMERMVAELLQEVRFLPMDTPIKLYPYPWLAHIAPTIRELVQQGRLYPLHDPWIARGPFVIAYDRLVKQRAEEGLSPPIPWHLFQEIALFILD